MMAAEHEADGARQFHAHGGAHPELPTASATQDPVCGMDVIPGDAPGGSAQHAGVTYWFCSASCRDRFAADPERYVSSPSREPEQPTATQGAADDRIYTCPMHPEVRQKGPGTCPKCGMALEPEAPAAAERPSA